MRALVPQIEAARAGVIAAQDSVAATDSGVKGILDGGRAGNYQRNRLTVADT